MQNQAAEQVVKIIKDSNNVLVTVKNSPSVDELTAAIGLTLMLNHMGKHSITVFSGRVPSMLEFLQPEMAIDSTTDSLRDFIIALDKSKADKLRYKVEDNVVRIFITPYKTSISEKDLEFSQGDFNVDAVVALGVVEKEDFDQAVTAHGRILHDATVVALTNHEVVSNIGAINWQEQQASSISEMVASISDSLGENVVDGQIATALMTGIVAETDRFRNSNTTPQVLSISAKLMSLGANQQLIAEKLEEADNKPATGLLIDQSSTDSDDGALEIEHDEDEVQNIHIDDNGNLELPADIGHAENTHPSPEEVANEPQIEHSYVESPEPPKLFGQDTSGTEVAQPLFEGASVADPPNTNTQGLDDELSQPYIEHHKKVIEPLSAEYQSSTHHPLDAQTLSDLEQAVASPHVTGGDSQNVDNFLGSTRQPVDQSQAPEPSVVSQAITEARQESAPPKEEQPVEEKKEEVPQQVEPLQQPPPQVVNPTAPPAVPPPLMPQATAQPQFFDEDGKNANPFLNPNEQ